MNNNFEDYFLTTCNNYALELEGPNSINYEQLSEDMSDDLDFRNACLNRYRMETGDCS